MVFRPALRFHGQNPVQRSCRDIQPPSYGNVVFHILVNLIAAHHQYMGAAQEVTAYINAAFVFLRDSVIEEQGQIERGQMGENPAS